MDLEYRRMDTDTDFDGFFAVCHFCLLAHTNLLTRQRQLMIASRNNIGYVSANH